MPPPFGPDDLVCGACLEDDSLKDIVRDEGTTGPCILCGASGNAVTVQQLGELLYPVARKFFVTTGNGRDGTPLGDDLSWMIQLILGQHLECEDAVIDALLEADPADVRRGGEPFIDPEAGYIEAPIDTTAHHSRWSALAHDLKHRRRFFNDDAKAFFDRLFDGLDCKSSPLSRSVSALGRAARMLPAGTDVFRARICDNEPELTRFLTSPEKELGAPPPSSATAGRMNPARIPVFYGARDDRTCVAELRPAIGQKVLVARFQTTAPLRVLDFANLERSYYAARPISYFQRDAAEELERWAFLRELHGLVAQPVLPGHFDDYLITQFLAEYLGHVRKPQFAGVLFKSVQVASGTNVVLLSSLRRPSTSASHRDATSAFPLTFVRDSAKLREIKSLSFRTTPVHFERDDKGGVHYMRDEYDGV